MAVPLLGAPAQRCGIAKQEQVEEDHKVQLEEDGEDEAVGGSRFVCLMQLPSLSGGSVLLPGGGVRSGNVGAVGNTC